MEKFFHLKENGTTVSTEILAGLTTFFAMAYIIVVNPQILSQTGMPWGGVFLATIIAAIIGTLVMGLFANVPYAQAAGMGLNAFFTYTVCFGLGFSWQQTMCMVFLCGLINILITVTKIRKMIILAIPESLQHAIGGGIGQMVPVIFYLIVYFVSPIPVRLRSGCLKPDAKMALQLYSIGVPAILNLALPSVLITFLNSLLAVCSQSYVVVLGIYYKLQTFLYLPANGIVQGLRPIIGYNYGAGEYDRVKKLYRTSMGMCAAIMAAGTVLCLALSGQLIGLFSSNAETIAIGTSALRIICVGFIVSTISVVASGSLEGLGMGVQSLVISLCRYIVVIMPLAWLFCRLLGADGIWNAFWVTEVITAGISLVVYHKSVKLK